MSTTAAVRLLIESKGSPLSPADAVLAALALDLAERLDRGEVDDRAVAAVSRELRATVADLSGGDDVDDFAALASRLSSPLGHGKD
jgi:hypothetical protein